MEEVKFPGRWEAKYITDGDKDIPYYKGLNGEEKIDYQVLLEIIEDKLIEHNVKLFNYRLEDKDLNNLKCQCLDENCGYKFRIPILNLLKDKSWNACPKCWKSKCTGSREYCDWLEYDLNKRFFEESLGEFILLDSTINDLDEVRYVHNSINCNYHVNKGMLRNVIKKQKCEICNKNNQHDRDWMHKKLLARLKYLGREKYIPLNKYKKVNTKIKFYHENCGNIVELSPNTVTSPRNGECCPICLEEEKIKNIEEKLLLHYGDRFEFIGFDKRNTINLKHLGCDELINIKVNKIGAKHLCTNCEEDNVYSKGELKLKTILDSAKLNYRYNYKIDYDNGRYGYVDFLILNKDGYVLFAIEYDGKQHFEPIEFFGGEERFKQQKERDRLKDEWFESKNIPLLRIKYNDDSNIKGKILEFLNN